MAQYDPDVWKAKEIVWRSIGFNPRGVKINLASGLDYRKDWLNVDYHNPTSDVELDLFHFPWNGLTSGTADAALMDNYLEHVPHQVYGRNALFLTMGELERILKPGGEALITVPYGTSENNLSNPAHFRLFVPSTLGFLWGVPWQRPTTIEYEATIGRKAPLELVRCRVRRRLGPEALNNLYHGPKYLRTDVLARVGRKWEISWLLRKPSPN